MTPAGNYVGVYWQYGRCHPIPAQQLTCTVVDATTGTALGHGFDDVGTFNTQGTYRAVRLVLTKQYVPGTGNPRENRGHAVALRLTYSALYETLPDRAAELQRYGAPAQGFYGTWHIRLPDYQGDAEMCLWLPAAPVVVGYVVTAVPVPLQPVVPVAQPMPLVAHAQAIGEDEAVPMGTAVMDSHVDDSPAGKGGSINSSLLPRT